MNMYLMFSIIWALMIIAGGSTLLAYIFGAPNLLNPLNWLGVLVVDILAAIPLIIWAFKA